MNEYTQRMTYMTLKTIATTRDRHGKTYTHPVHLLRSDYDRIPSLILYIDNTPGRWYLSTLLGRDGYGREVGTTIAIDAGQNWDCINMDEVMREVKSLFGTLIHPETLVQLETVQAK